MKSNVREVERPQLFATVKLRFSGLQFEETRGQQDTQVKKQGEPFTTWRGKHAQNDHRDLFAYIFLYHRVFR